MSQLAEIVELPGLTDLQLVVNGNIRAEVARVGWNQSDIAHILGISKVAVSQRWNAHTPWTIADIEKVANALGLEEYELLLRPKKNPHSRSVPDSYTARDSNPEPID